MNNFVVMVEPRNLRDQVVGRVATAGVPRETLFAASAEPPRFAAGDYGYDPRVMLDCIPYFTDDEQSAQDMALRLAHTHPSRRVVVSKITGIATSNPSAPVLVAVSEKGMVPR